MVARSLTVRTFSRQVGVSQGFISHVKQGPMPLARVATWADALGLTAAERERFEHLALLTHTPPQIGAYLAALEQRVVALETAAAAAPVRAGSRRPTRHRRSSSSHLPP